MIILLVFDKLIMLHHYFNHSYILCRYLMKLLQNVLDAEETLVLLIGRLVQFFCDFFGQCYRFKHHSSDYCLIMLLHILRAYFVILFFGYCYLYFSITAETVEIYFVTSALMEELLLHLKTMLLKFVFVTVAWYASVAP